MLIMKIEIMPRKDGKGLDKNKHDGLVTRKSDQVYLTGT